MNTHVTPVNKVKIKIFSHPAITDSRFYGHQNAVPRVSAIAGVDCIVTKLT